MRKTVFALLFLCLGLQAILGYKIWRRMQVETLEVKVPTLTFRAARQLFPFSVIPGGVLDERELADSISKDVVVRKHYHDLHPERMWFTRTNKPLLCYVSYRKGDDVRWTDHPVIIPANELVLTDGKNMVRARCGNRIEIRKPEPLPSSVIPPDVPPPDIAMDTALPALVPPTIVPPVPPASEFAKAGEMPPPHLTTPPTTWCCGVVGGTTPATPVLPSVPEPPTLFLVLAGALGVLAIAGRKLF